MELGCEGQEASRDRDRKLKSVRDSIRPCKTKKKKHFFGHIASWKDKENLGLSVKCMCKRGAELAIPEMHMPLHTHTKDPGTALP